MPYKKSKSVRRKRRTTRRYKRRIPKNYTFIRLRFVTAILSNGTGVISDLRSLGQITTCQNYSDLAGVYDQFQVNAMKVKYIPYNVGDESSSVGGNTRGNVCSVIDMNGANLPTSVGTASAWDTFKLVPAYYPHQRYIRIPKKYRPALNNFATGFDTTSNDDVTFCLLGDSFNNSTTQFYVVITYYIKCIGVK